MGGCNLSALRYSPWRRPPSEMWKLQVEVLCGDHLLLLWEVLTRRLRWFSRALHCFQLKMKVDKVRKGWMRHRGLTEIEGLWRGTYLPLIAVSSQGWGVGEGSAGIFWGPRHIQRRIRTPSFAECKCLLSTNRTEFFFAFSNFQMLWRDHRLQDLLNIAMRLYMTTLRGGGVLPEMAQLRTQTKNTVPSNNMKTTNYFGVSMKEVRWAEVSTSFARSKNMESIESSVSF